MSYELLNTSAPRGVRPGMAGFCTVGITAGMPAALEERLTLLSGYRWVVPPGERGAVAQANPIAWAHWRSTLGGRPLSVLSRVADARFDYTRRSNRLAHHVVLDPAEQAAAAPGPAWVMRQPGVMRASWAGEPMIFDEGPDIPRAAALPPRACHAWASVAGDAGWAGALASAYASGGPASVACLIYPSGVDVLTLIDEALALLPQADRWQVTFNTYFTDLPAGMTCAWRCCLAGTPAADDARRQATSGLVIDLTRPLGAAPDSPYARAARTDGDVAGAMAARLLRSTASHFDSSADPIDDADAETRAAAVAMARAATMAQDDVDPRYAAPSGAPIAQRAGGLPAEASAPEKPDMPAEQSSAALELTRDASAPRNRLVSRGQGPHPAFWALAIAWPVAVAGGVLAYRRTSAPSAAPAPPVVAHVPSAPATQTAAGPRGVPDDGVPAAIHDATVRRATEAERTVREQGVAIARLERQLADLRRTLAVQSSAAPATSPANARASDNAATEAELAHLREEASDLRAQLARAVKLAANAAADRAVDPFHDEMELWGGDGEGPADQLRFDGYPPPESLTIDRAPTRLVLKAAAPVSATAEGASVKSPPVELAVIGIEGPRVVMRWVGGATRAQQFPAAGRAWLQFSRLRIERNGRLVASARFIPRRAVELNVDREQPASLVPDVHWKEALQHAALTPPPTAPEGWTLTRKDELTMSVASARSPAAFDVQLVLTATGELRAQTTYASAVYRQVASAQDQSAAASAKRTAATRYDQLIEALAGPSGVSAKDPAHQKDLDGARQQRDAASAALRVAEASRKAAEDALADLRALPTISFNVVNRENGLVLTVLRVGRGG